MDLRTKLRYQGYTSTPSLWKNGAVSQFEQIELAGNSEIMDDSTVFKNKRLGKLVEEFVFYELKQRDAVSWICDNLQIQDGKRTVGEIDALYYDDGKPVHLEIVYKFYLYDRIGNYDEPLDYWIGPNRKDSLVYKLEKLHDKQFPLLQDELSQPYLENYNLDIKTIKQELCFKAQLFLPYPNRHIDISPLNNDCIAGFYISFQEMELFKKLEFFIPTKLDWLVTPNFKVTWINYSAALKIIETEVNNKRSPLVWIKESDYEFIKCFISYW